MEKGERRERETEEKRVKKRDSRRNGSYLSESCVNNEQIQSLSTVYSVVLLN